jgi:hypothetical protein
MLLWAAGTFAAGASAPATRPSGVAPAGQPLRYLEPGSWVVTEAHVRTNGSPSAMRRKVVLAADPKSGVRTVQEMRWKGEAFDAEGPAVAAGEADRRTFDQLGLTIDSTQPEQAVTVGRRRYVCSVTTYVFADEAGGRTTTLTLWRDRSGQTQLPPRTIAVGEREIPLPADALQAEFVVRGPKGQTKGERRIVSMAAPLRVGEQTLNCLAEATRVTGTSGERPLTIVRREWFSHDLPGEPLRTLTVMNGGAAEVESDVTVVDFHAVRPDAGQTARHAMPTAATPGE